MSINQIVCPNGALPALDGLPERRKLMDIQKHSWEVADQEDHDDGQEDDGQAVFLSPQESDVLRIVAVDVLLLLNVAEACAPLMWRIIIFCRVDGVSLICRVLVHRLLIRGEPDGHVAVLGPVLSFGFVSLCLRNYAILNQICGIMFLN